MRRHVPRRFAILLAGLVALVVGVPFGATAFGDPGGASSDGDGRGDQRLRQVGYFIQWGSTGVLST
jgi:hypothetical protein